MYHKRNDMSVNILTDDQAKNIALDAIELFVKRFFPSGFPDLAISPSQSAPGKQNTSDTLLTVKQLAEYWQCHQQTIMQKKRKGQLPFVQHGRKLFFRKSEIDALTATPADKRFLKNRV